jgi:hypothetical protein
MFDLRGAQLHVNRRACALPLHTSTIIPTIIEIPTVQMTPILVMPRKHNPEAHEPAPAVTHFTSCINRQQITSVSRLSRVWFSKSSDINMIGSKAHQKLETKEFLKTEEMKS